MLKSLTPGQQINDKFGILSITEKTTANGDPYLVIELTHPSGTIAGKVWSDSIPNVKVKEGDVAELKGTVDQYRGVNNFNIQNARQVPNEDLLDYVTEKPTLVFDIETVGRPFEELDEHDQDYFLNNLEKNFEGTKQQLHDRTGLYPLFGFVVTIGMYNPGTEKGAVYYLTSSKKQKATNKKLQTGDKSAKESPAHQSKEAFIYRGFADEKSLLEGFWETALKYERFVTYNGAGFDWPFLVFRSGVHRVKVPFETKGNGDKFIDLSQKIRVGYRPYRLEQLCKAFQISNPKEDGVSGMEVAKLYRQGKLEEILKYVSRDAKSTSELYMLWKTYLAGKIIV